MKTKRYVRVIIVLITAVTLLFTADQSTAKSKEYRNNYNGIYTGLSTVNDVIRKMGKPIRIENAGMGKNYRYEKVIINFAKSSKPKVNTIIIDRDYNYIDKNCFKIGSSIDNVRDKLGKREYKTISDKKKGIVYWHDGEKVTKIVLVRSMSVAY